MKQVILATFTNTGSAANTWNDLSEIDLDAEIVALANGLWKGHPYNQRTFKVTNARILEFQGDGPVKIALENGWYFYGHPEDGATIKIVARTEKRKDQARCQE